MNYYIRFLEDERYRILRDDIVLYEVELSYGTNTILFKSPDGATETWLTMPSLGMTPELLKAEYSDNGTRYTYGIEIQGVFLRKYYARIEDDEIFIRRRFNALKIFVNGLNAGKDTSLKGFFINTAIVNNKRLMATVLTMLFYEYYRLHVVPSGVYL